MSRLPIQGEYPPDWPAIGDRVRAEAGHRCIRCGHPYRTGEHGKGEWTPCDERCTHAGPLGILYPNGEILECGDSRLFEPGKGEGLFIVARWRILTVHHMTGSKKCNKWWNLLSLCQRCHLTIQGKLNPQITYFLEHSDWIKPYVAGFYAAKYEGRDLTREQVMAEMDRLLAHERIA